MDIQWESEIAQLLGRLGTTQDRLLKLLSKKHDLLKQRDHHGISTLAEEEQSLCNDLQECHSQRQRLLDQAAHAGLPADSIQSLAQALPEDRASTLQKPLNESMHRSHLLRHQSFTHWVVVQRTLLHLSQMLEIIATGGRQQPTYGKDGSTQNSGALMDQAV